MSDARPDPSHGSAGAAGAPGDTASAAAGRRALVVRDVGRMAYGEALALQEQLVDQRIAEEIPDTLVLVEHPPVITLGRGANDNDILLAREELERRGVEIHRITRGGLVTYHGPGQLVGYPIVNLYERARQIKRFIHSLESVFIDVLSEGYGIHAEHDPAERGVWVDGARKITAVGIAIKRRVTMHGFAFNVDPDMSHFRWIVPCGISDRGVTSLSLELGRSVGLAEAKTQVVDKFAKRFGYEVVEGDQAAGNR